MSGEKGHILIQSPPGAQGIGVDGYKWTSSVPNTSGSPGRRPAAFLAQVKRGGSERSSKEKSNVEKVESGGKPKEKAEEEELCTCGNGQRVNQLAHDLEHVTFVHERLLQGLHAQIEQLKVKNRDLTFQLLMSPFAASVQENLPFSPESDDNSVKTDNMISSASTLPKSLSSTSSGAFEVITTPEDLQKESIAKSKITAPLRKTSNVVETIGSRIQNQAQGLKLGEVENGFTVAPKEVESDRIQHQTQGTVLGQVVTGTEVTPKDAASISDTGGVSKLRPVGKTAKVSSHKSIVSNPDEGSHSNQDHGKTSQNSSTNEDFATLLNNTNSDKIILNSSSNPIPFKTNSTNPKEEGKSQDPKPGLRPVRPDQNLDRSRIQAPDPRTLHSPPPTEEDGPSAMILWRARRGRAGHGDPRQVRSLDLELLEQEALQTASKLREERAKTEYLTGLVADLRRELSQQRSSLVIDTHAPAPWVPYVMPAAHGVPGKLAPQAGSLTRQHASFAAAKKQSFKAWPEKDDDEQSQVHESSSILSQQPKDIDKTPQRGRHANRSRDGDVRGMESGNGNSTGVSLPPINERVKSRVSSFEQTWSSASVTSSLPSAVVLPSITSKGGKNMTIVSGRNQSPSLSSAGVSDFEQLLRKNKQKSKELRSQQERSLQRQQQNPRNAHGRSYENVSRTTGQSGSGSVGNLSSVSPSVKLGDTNSLSPKRHSVSVKTNPVDSSNNSVYSESNIDKSSAIGAAGASSSRRIINSPSRSTKQQGSPTPRRKNPVLSSPSRNGSSTSASRSKLGSSDSDRPSTTLSGSGSPRRTYLGSAAGHENSCDSATKRRQRSTSRSSGKGQVIVPVSNSISSVNSDVNSSTRINSHQAQDSGRSFLHSDPIVMLENTPSAVGNIDHATQFVDGSGHPDRNELELENGDENEGGPSNLGNTNVAGESTSSGTKLGGAESGARTKTKNRNRNHRRGGRGKHKKEQSSAALS